MSGEENLHPTSLRNNTEFRKRLEQSQVSAATSSMADDSSYTFSISDAERIKKKMHISNLVNAEDSDHFVGVNRDLNNPIPVNSSRRSKARSVLFHLPAGFPDCVLCPERLNFHNELAEHLIQVHGYPMLECPQCVFKCAKRNQMRRHMRIKHDIYPGIFHCYACVYVTNNAERFKDHLREEHFRCPYCNIGFDKLSAHETMCALHPKNAQQYTVNSSS